MIRTDYEVQGLASGVGLFFVLLHIFSAGGGEVPLAGGFFGRSPVSGDRKKTQDNGTGFRLG